MSAGLYEIISLQQREALEKIGYRISPALVANSTEGAELARACAEITRLQTALHGAIDYVQCLGKAHPDLVLSIHGLHPIQEATARWQHALGQRQS